MEDHLLIGEVAELFNVSTKTLRHYEKLGLLAPQRAQNDYRLYGPQDVLRLQRIRQLQSLGLSLREIRRILERADDEQLWSEVLRALRQEVSAEMALLEERLAQIERLLEEEMPPDREDLPATPQKVEEYLEQHLPQARLGGWRRDRAIYMTLRTFLTPPLGGTPLPGPAGDGQDLLSSSPFNRPWLAPSHPGYAEGRPGTSHSISEQYARGALTILRALQDQERSQGDEEE